MTKLKNWWLPIVAFSLALSAPASAQLELESSTANGGGGTSTGGSFEVSGTIGQLDAGTATGGVFAIQGGFWTSENPAVPVELMSFEIASSRPRSRQSLNLASVTERPMCRLDARPSAPVQRPDPTSRRAIPKDGVS